MIIHYTDDIRSIMNAQDMRNIAMSYAEADEIPISDYRIQGMLRAADEFDYLEDDFLYWIYALAMIEEIIEDDDDDLYSLSYELCGCYPPPDSSIFTACAKARLLHDAPNMESSYIYSPYPAISQN